MKKFNEELYLVDMYRDGYFPNFLVDKIKVLLMQGVELLEGGERNLEVIQSKFDDITDAINDLQDEFDENGSEIETGARESICETVRHIIECFELDVDDETLMGNRDW